jgi:hypothetical protein
MHEHRDNIFLDCEGVLIITLAVEKLLEASDLTVNNLLLSFEFSFKDKSVES